jgi:hypothetical protein
MSYEARGVTHEDTAARATIRCSPRTLLPGPGFTAGQREYRA